MAEIIVALDESNRGDALAVVDALPGLRWVKVGSTLFAAEGPALVRELKTRGLRVFLDLKWHDIPGQVAGAVRAADVLGVDLVTVHALGGAAMLAAAAAASAGVRGAAGFVLTSHDADDWGFVVGRRADLVTEVTRLAHVVAGAGLTAMVVAPGEAGVVRAALGSASWVITPGIRPPAAPADDQRRVATPAAAVAAGATHLVVGRPITRAPNPVAVYEELCHDAG